jgi:hypothetical protein
MPVAQGIVNQSERALRSHRSDHAIMSCVMAEIHHQTLIGENSIMPNIGTPSLAMLLALANIAVCLTVHGLANRGEAARKPTMADAVLDDLGHVRQPGSAAPSR